MKPRLALIVDDEPLQREILCGFLSKQGFNTLSSSSGKEALEILSQQGEAIQVVFTDLSMPEMSGIELVSRAKAEGHTGIDFFVITAHATVDTAIQALKAGAVDYLLKPLEFEEVERKLKLLLRLRSLERKTVELERERKTLLGEPLIVAQSPAMKKLLSELERIAQTDANVLISGETGSGKEVLSHYIHQKSARSSGQFLPVNCSAIPENLVESEFFGYEKGAFTGADKRTDGFFQKSDGGTLFLDEIGEMDLRMQPKLLRAIESRKVRRVGGAQDVAVDIRLITATHRNLRELVTQGKFREDLFYRLNVVYIQIPPLRERKEDIAELVRHLIHRYGARLNKPVQGVDPGYLSALEKYAFPGNVRELANLVERSLIYMKGNELTLEALPLEVRTPTPSVNPSAASTLTVFSGNLAEQIAAFEKDAVLKSLARNDNDPKRSARELGVSLSTFYVKLSKHGLK